MVARVNLSVTAVIIVCVFPSEVVAQHPFTPGVAFGAFVYPHVDGDLDVWAVQSDLFTELSKDLNATTNDFRVYNDIDRTLGFNQVGYTRVRWNSLGPASWHTAYWGAAGLIWDTPTEFLQNDFAHGLRLLTYVPRDGVVEHVVFGAGADQNLSYPWAPLSWLDVLVLGGAGAGVSSSYFDWYVQTGSDLTLFPSARGWVRVGGLWRKGWVQDPAHWDRLDRGLHDQYWLLQGWLLLPLDSWFSAAWGPRLRGTFTYSKGPFARFGMTGPITERLVSVRLESSPGQWAVEMWNDFGFKDLGPTFGLRVQWY